jgi:DNA-binding transcriptional ArsR family regulator
VEAQAARHSAEPAEKHPAPAVRRAPEQLDASLRALADENRRTILSLVKDTPLAVGDIAAQVDVTQQAVSHHLAVLKKAGLVDESRDGTRHLFAVRTDGFEAVRSYLDDFWPARLAALKRAVEDASNA